MGKQLTVDINLLYNIFMDQPLISVVIPSFNEMPNLQKGVLQKVVLFLVHKHIKFELILVDDGSQDGSYEYVYSFSKDQSYIKVVKNKHLGKAGATTTGMLKAKGKYVLFTDMDQATPIEEIDKLLPYFQDGYDLVIGSRSSKRKGAPISRLFMAKSMIYFRTLIVGSFDVKDTQCGFKMFTHQAAQDIFQKLYDLHKGFKVINGSNVTAAFDVELLYIAKRLGYKIKEVPVSWLYVETRRVNPVKDSVEGLVGLIRLRFNILKGKYSKFI